MKYYAIGIVLTLLIGGCGPQGEQIMIQNARGVDYSTGYGDGCASGRRAAGNTQIVARRDAMNYMNNPRYKSGWNQGYKECKFREKRVVKLPNTMR